MKLFIADGLDQHLLSVGVEISEGLGGKLFAEQAEHDDGVFVVKLLEQKGKVCRHHFIDECFELGKLLLFQKLDQGVNDFVDFFFHGFNSSCDSMVARVLK